MKKLFTLFFWFVSHCALAQEPMPFPTGQRWMVIKTHSFTNEHYNYSIINAGLTVLDEVSYHTLISTEDCATLYQNQPTKYLRDEAGVWYIKDDLNSPERVYFDFNLEVGDVFDWAMEDGIEMTVTSIEEITMTDGTTRRLWTIDTFSYQFLEGAGEVRTAFEFYPSLISHVSDAIVCLKDSEDNLIHQLDSEVACCFYTGHSIPTDYTWQMSTEMYNGHQYQNYALKIVAQDTINDTIYHRVESIYSGCTVGHEGGVETFFVRDEAGVWYRRASALMPEELIFDFNAEVGDTFLLSSTEYDEINPYVVEVMAIDEIELPNGETRNQWEVQFEFQPWWSITEYYIEGIGSRFSGLSTMSYNSMSHEVLTCLQNGSNQYIYWANFEFSPNPGCCYYIGVDEYAKSQIEIFPNPTNDIINLKFSNADKWVIQLVNSQGKVVKEENNNGSLQYTMDVQDLPSGIYTAMCKDGKGKVFTEKVVNQ